MDRLEQLPETTDHVLAGLKADNDLKHRIISAATATHTSPIRARTVLALCSLSLLLILVSFFITRIPAGSSNASDIHVIPAGSHRMVSPVNMQQVIDQAAEAGGQIQEETNSADY